MEISTVSSGVPEGLDQFLALNPNPETQAEIMSLKGAYADRTAHESRARSAQEELAVAETALLAHGAPHEPFAIVGEEVLSDIDLHLKRMQAARAKFRGEDDSAT